MRCSTNSSAVSSLRVRLGWKWVVLLLAAALPLLVPLSALGQSNSPLYWDTTTGTWSAAATNWVTSLGAAASSDPTTTNDVVFNYSGVTAANETVSLSAPQSVMGLYFTNTDTTTLQSLTSASEALSIGTDGINIGSTAGAVTLGNSTDLMPISITGSQTWTNNSAATTGLTVVNGVSETATSTLTLAGSGTTLFSGGVTNGTGTLSLRMIGSGAVTLSGTGVTYTGATTINSGTLTLQGATGFASATTINANGTLTLNSTNGTQDNWISSSATFAGTGIINKTGTGWIDFANANALTNFNGTLNIQAGTFGPGNGTGGFGSATSTMAVNVSSGALFDIRATGPGSGFSAFVDISQLTGTGIVGTTYPDSTAGFTIGTGNGSSLFAGTIEGNGSAGMNLSSNPNAAALSMTKVGTGTFTLTGANSYTGATIVNAGTLLLNYSTNASVLSASSALTLGGGTLNITANGSGATAQSLASLSLTAGTVSGIALNPNGGSGATLTFTSGTLTAGAGSALNFNYSAGSTNGATVGNDVVAFTAAPTLVAGILGGGYTVTDTAGTGYATVNGSKQVVRLVDPGNAGLPTSTGSATANYFIGSNYGTTSTSTPGSLVEVLSAGVAANTVTINTANLASGANLALGANTLTLTTGGGMTFSGPNPYTITANAVAAGGTGGITTSVSAGSTVFNNFDSSTVTINAPIVKNGANTVTFAGTGTTVLAGASTYTGTTNVGSGTVEVLLSNDSAWASSIATAAGATTQINGVGVVANAAAISITGTGTLVKTGGGVWDLGDSGKVSMLMSAGGLVDIQQGVISTNDHLNVWASNLASVEVDAGAVLDLYADGGQMDALTGAGTVRNSYNPSGIQTLIVGVANGSGTFSGSIITGGGDIALTKSGIGTETLSGINTFTGNTTVSAGTLDLSNTWALENSTVATGGTGLVFDSSVASHAFVLGGLSGSANLILQDNAGTPNAVALSIGNNNTGSTCSGVLSGAGSLTKLGTGTLILSGANTYTGVTSIGGSGTLTVTGSLRAGSPLTFIGTGALNVAEANGSSQSMGTFTLGAGDATVTSAYGTSGTTTLTFSNVAARTVGATANFVSSGGTNGSTNDIVLTQFGGATTPTATLLDPGMFFGGTSYAAYDVGGFLRAYGSSDANYLAAPAGTTVGASTSSTNVALTGSITAQTTVSANTINMGAFSIAMSAAGQTLSTNGLLSAGSGSATIATAGSFLQPATAGGEIVVRVNGATDGLSISSIIQNNSTASSLTKSGLGALTISGANTYSGGTYLNAGTLVLGNANALGTGALTINGGSLNSSVANLVNAGNNAQNWNGDFTFVGTQNLNLGAGAVTLGANRTVTLTADTLTVGGPVSGSGDSLTTTGAGTLLLSGPVSNTYSGGTFIDGTGSIGLGKTGGAIAIPGNVTMLDSTTTHLYATQNNQFAPGAVLSFIGSGSNARFELGGTTQTLAGIVANDGATSVAVIQTTEQTPAASVNGSLLVLNGSGNYFFQGYFRSTGGIIGLTLNGTGTQTLAGAQITYTGATTVTSGTLILADTTGFASPIAVSASGTLDSSRSAVGFANRSQILGNDMTGSGVININNAAGGLAGGWTTVAGAGALTFAGTININSGEFGRDGTNANAINSTATVNVAAGAVFGAGRQGNSTIGALNGAGDVSTTWSGTNAGSIIIGNGGGSGSFSGILHGNGTNATDGTLEGGILSVIKIGSGTETLSGANTYTGGTIVDGGTLLLNYAVNPTVLTSTSALTLGGGTLGLQGNSSGTTAQTLASLALTAGTSSIAINPNGGSGTTLTITSTTLTAGTGSAANFNYTAGTTVGATVGNEAIAFASTPTLTGGILGGAYTVTDTGGTGFAAVNGSNQIVRLTDPGSDGLPTSTGSPTANYFVSQSYSTSVTTTPGSLVEALSAGTAANTITVNTSGLSSGANLALGANTLTLTSGGGMLFLGANPYTISAVGGNLMASAGSGSLVFTNDTSSTLTVSAPIVDNSTTAVTIAGSGTTVLSGVNTYTGGTGLTGGGTVSVGHVADSGLSNLGYTGALTLGGDTLQFTGVGGTTTRNLAITAPSTIDVTAGGTLGFTGTGSGGGGLTVNGPGTLTLGVTNSSPDTANRLYIGTTATDIGSLTVNSGTVVVPLMYITSGEAGGSTAQFTINGGTVFHNATTGGIYLDNNTGANSVMTINGGAYVDGGALVMGAVAGFTATMNLNAGTFASASGINQIGENGTGVWNQTGGLADVAANQLYLGNAAGSSGTINLSGGTLLVPTNWIQVGINGSGAMTISGTGSAVAYQFLMSNGAANSVMNMNGGNLFVTNGVTGIGYGGAGNATWNQTAGTALLLATTYVANGSGAGTLNISGGTFEDGAGVFYLGVNNTTGNTATLNVSGSAFVSVNQLNLGYQAGVISNVNLNGGLLRLYGETGGNLSAAALGTDTVYFNGGTLQLGATISTPSGITNVIQNGGALIDTQSYTYTVNSPFIPGAGSTGGLTKFGGGTLALTSAAGSTYAGATTLDGGTLLLNFTSLGTNLLPGTSALNLNAGSTLNLKGQSGAITSQTLGNLTLNNGGGTILFTPNSSTSTTLTLGNTWTNNNNSTLLIDESAAGTSIVTSNPSAALNTNGFIPWATVKTPTAFGFASVSAGNVVPFAPAGGTLPGASAGPSADYTLSGASANQTITASETADSLTIAPTAASQSLAISGSQVLSFTAGAVAFDGTGAAYSITGPGQLGASGAALTLSTYGANALTISAPVSGGAGSLILGGAGTTILSGTNSYSGGTQLNNGTLILGSTTALGSGTLNINGGTLDSNVASLVNANNNAQAWNGNFTFAGTNALNLGTGAVSLGANVQINTSASVTTTPLTVGGNISGSFGLAKIGTGLLVLSGSNTYTGTTALSGGFLQLSSTSGYAIPGNVVENGTTNPAVYTTVNNQFAPGSVLSYVGTSNAYFELLGTTQTLAGIDNSAATSTDGFIQNYKTGFSPITNSGASTLVLNGSGNYYYSGTISNGTTGTIGLTYNGTGTQVLSGSLIQYTGPTVVNSGTLELYGTTNFNSPITVNAGAMLSLYGNNSNDTSASLTLNGGTLTDNAYGNQTDEGAVIIAAPTTFTVNNSGSINQFFFDGGLSGSGQTLTINNYGSTTTGESFRNNTGSNFTGPLIVNGGQINIANNASAALANANLTLNNAILNLGVTYGMSSAAGATLASLNGNGTVTAAGSTVALTVGNNGGTGSFSGTLINGGGTLGLTKIGSGTQTLNGSVASNYTGATTVNGGTLVLDLSNIPTSTNLLSASSPLTLGGGTLEILANSIGTSAQTLASLSLTAATSSSIAINPNGGSGATLTITSGTLATGAGSLVNFNYTAGTTVGATVGNDIVAFTTSPVATGSALGGAYTVTDTGGFGLAGINASKQVVRIIDPGNAGLPVSGGSAATNYFVNQTYSTSVSTTPGSLVEALSGSVAADTVTIDTTGVSSGANLALGANTLTLTSGGGIFFTGANPYTISASGGNLAASASGSLVFDNYNSSTVTVSAPITDNSTTTSLTVAGTGTTVLGGANTYLGGTTLIGGGTLSVGHVADGGTSNLGYTGALTLDGGTLQITGVGGTTARNLAITARNLAITAPATIDVAAGGTLGFTGIGSGGGGLTFNGPGTLNLDVTSGSGSHPSDSLHIGTNPTDIGSLTINSGVVNVPQAYILFGETGGGTAQLTINGGTLYHNASSNGTYVSNDTGANSLLTINGGAYVEGGLLNLSTVAGFTSTLNLNAGTAVFAGGGTNVIGVAGSGIFNQTGGASYFAGNVNTSNGAGTSTMSISAGTSNTIGILYVGVNSAGTLNISGTAFVFPEDLNIYGNGQTGTINMSGGELYVGANNSYIGQTAGGTSTFNQTGGTTIYTNQVLVAAGTGSGTLNLSGGTFEQTAGGFFLGFTSTGPGTLNVSGSAFVSLNVLSFNYSSTTNGTLNLNGGTLRIFGESYGQSSPGGTGTFNFNGGTLQVAAANISAPSQVTNVIQSGGAVIDTQNYTYTEPSPFTAGTGGGGLTKFGGGTLSLTSAAGSTYAGATTVSGGTLLANFSNMTTPTNLLPSGSALNLNAGSTLNLEGKGSAATAQTLGNLTLNNGGGTILFTPNSDTSTTLTLGTTWTENNNSTLLIDESAAGTSTLTSNPSTALNANGFISWATVKNPSAFGFASVLSGNVVPYVPGGGALPGSGANYSTDYNLSGGAPSSQSVTSSETADSLTIAPTSGVQSLAINANQVLSLAAGAVAFDGSTTPYSITGPGQFGASGTALTLSTYGTNPLTISAPISGGAGSLILGGTGKTILSGTNNTYSGGTQLNSGTLSLGSATALGSGTLTIDGGTLDSNVAGLVDTSNNSEIWNGNFTFAGTNALNLGTGNVTLGANVQINTSSSTTTTPLTVAGNISGSYGLSKVGAGMLVLTGSNTYTGTTTDSQGNLQLSSTTGYAIPGNFIGNNVLSPHVYTTANNQFAPGSVMYFVGTGGDHVRFELLGTTQTLAGIDNSASGMGVIQNYEQAPIATYGYGELVLNGSGNYFFNGYLRDDGTNNAAHGTIGLTYNGTGTQVLSGGNISYTGRTVINSGTLELYNSSGFNSATTVNTGATLSVFGSGSTYTSAPLTMNGGTINDTAYGAETAEGAVVIAVPTTVTVTNNGSNDSLYFDGGLYGSGQTLTFNNYGATTTGEILRGSTGTNFSGSVIVNGGQLAIGLFTPSSLGSAALALANADLTLNNATLNLGGAFSTTATGATLHSLNGNGVVTSAGATETLAVGNNGGTGSFSGTLVNGTLGTLNFTKIGSGTQTLNGPVASTYTGATTVAAGTLLLDMSNMPSATPTGLLSSSSALTLGGGTLKVLGVGTATQSLGALTLNGGGLAIANQGGSTALTLASITRTAGATLNVDLSSGAGTNTLTFISTTGIPASGPIGWASVTDATGTGFATLSGNNIIRYTVAGTVLTATDATSSTGTTNFTTNPSTDGYANSTLALTSTSPNATNSLNITAAAPGTLDLGGGNLTLTTGGLLMSGASNYTIQNGQLGASGAELDINQTGAGFLTVSAAIRDTGSPVTTLGKGGSGTLILTGANTYTGTTNINAGTLQIGAGGASGALGTGNVANGGTLIYDLTGTTSWANTISGAGALTLNGGGALTLTGTGSNYTGPTTINSGSLFLNGSFTAFASPITANSGTLVQINNTLPAAANVNLNDATLQLLTNSATVNSITVNGTSAGSTIKVGSGLVLTSTTGLFGTNQTVTVNMTAGGSTGLNLTNAGNYSGTITVNAGSNTHDYLGVNSVAAETALINTDLVLNGTGSPGVGYAGAELYLGNNANGNVEVHSLTGTAASNIDVDNHNRIVVLGTNNNTATKTTFAGDTWGNSTGFDSVGFVKNGTYTQEFSGAGIYYNGVSTLNNGTLEFTDTTNLSANTVMGITLDPVNAVTLQLNANATNWTLTKIVSGGSANASVTKLGPDILTMNAQNTYTAPTTISGGELKLGVAETAGTSGPLGDSAAINPGNIIFAGGTLQYSTSNQFDYSGRFSTAASQPISIDTTAQNVTFATALSSSGGTLTKLGSGTLTLTAPETYTGLTTITTGTLQFGNGTSGADGSLVATGGIADNATLTFNIFGTQTYAGAIGGSGAVTKSGAGTQILSGTNGYSGGTTVSAGTLLANGPAATGTTSSTGTGNVTVGPNGALGGSGSVLSLGGGSVSIQDTGTILGAAGQTLTINGTLNLANNAASSSSIATLTPGATGAAALIYAASLSAPGSGTARIDITNSASLGTGSYDLIGYGTGPGAANPAVNFGFTTGVTFSSGDTAKLVTTGSQLDLVITTPVTWTGASSSSWDTTPVQNWATGSLTPTQYSEGDPVTFADTNPITTNPITNTNVSIQNGGVNPASVTFTNNTVTYTISDAGGSAGISGSTGISMTGMGTVNLAGANSFTGLVSISKGIINISNPLSLGDSTSNGVSLSGGVLQMQNNITTTNAIPLTFNGPDVSTGALNNLSGSNTYTGGLKLNTPSSIGSTAGTLTLSGGINNNGNLLNFTGAGNTTVSTLGISGGGGLTYNGGTSNSVLTLAASNGYTGPTSVNSGTLRVASTGSLASAVTVNSTGILSGPGTISSLVTVNSGGILAPTGIAGQTGAMNLTGGLTLSSGSVLDFNVSNAGDDAINVSGGTFTIGTGTLNIYTGGGALTTNTYYPLIDFTGAPANDIGSPWTVTKSGDDSGHTYSFVLSGNTFELYVTAANGSGTWSSNGSGGNPTDYGTAANWSSTTVPSGIGLVATFGTGSETTVSVTSGYTVGQLNFNNGGNTGSPPSPTSYNLSGAGSLTLNNSGNSGGASVNVSSGGLNSTLGPSLTLTLADPSLTTTFNIASGSSLDVGGPITQTVSNEKIVLTGGGTLTLDNGASSYSGGTTVNSGTLILDPPLGAGVATLGTGPLAINGSTSIVNVNPANYALTIGSLSGTGSGQLNVSTFTALTVNQSTSGTFAGTLSLGMNSGLVLQQASGNTLTISGATSLAGGNSIAVNSGTLALTNNTAGPASIAGSATVSVAPGATLQLAGTSAVLSSTVNITTQGSGTSGDGALTVVGTTTQTVGVISGNTLGGSVTTYAGNTTVGDGTNVANLTATQILQNTLTINAGSTVTIAPSGPGIETAEDANAATAAVASAETSAETSSDSSSDPFTAIQAAIASGSITSVKGEQLENRIAAIERLAATDPGLDVSLLEDRVLAALPAPSVWSSSGTAPLVETGSGLLAVDNETSGATSSSMLGGATAFAPATDFGGSPAAVPEPSTLLLAALGGIGILMAFRRRTIHCGQ